MGYFRLLLKYITPPTGKINHNLRSKSTEQQLSLIGFLKTSANSHVRDHDGRYIVSGSDWCVKIWNNDKANRHRYVLEELMSVRKHGKDGGWKWG
ncbi:hypothetical protein LENED_006199 [Lentinula edodes]|uniref:WD40 repeat-like protein n=1 Tax=Lentinula edodes TaxID=5353 RepID=A0A1Q3EB45_LENED|nr:hypothetical protein LENED_006199 [Lentinula edodes]